MPTAQSIAVPKLSPGESSVATLGLCATGIVVAAIFSAVWWADGPWPGLAGVVLVSLLMLILAYRHARSRSETLGRIGEALLSRSQGESEAAALRIGGASSPEQAAWNDLIDRMDALERRALVRESATTRLEDRGAVGQLQVACETLPEGMLLVNAEGVVTYANRAAATLLGSTVPQVVGTPARSVLSDPDVAEAVERTGVEGSSRRMTFEIDHTEETDPATIRAVLRFSVRPVRPGDAGVAMVIIEDITQQRVAADSRSSFLAHATHELRTPLTNIRLYAESAIDAKPEEAESVRRSLNVIQQESRRLETIVQDMLSISEIEAGGRSLRIDDVPLGAMLEQMRLEFAAQAEAAQLELRLELPPKLPPVRGDRDKLGVAIHNLIGNAVKYTPAGGAVSIAVEHEGRMLRVAVSDTGIGISEADQAKLFQRFFRAEDKRVRDVQGTGLGLALAREVVRLHDGDIEVQSTPGQGATFTLEIPVAEGAG
ncbi:MAG: ATP-binding protein [Planctomycetota bacterium]